jgi:hypothetical protein
MQQVSKVQWYREVPIERPARTVFTFFDEEDNAPVVELEFDMQKKKYWWVKPKANQKTRPFTAVLEITQELGKQQYQGSIAV